MNDRFINPYTDYGFKKLFGTEQNADLLISFLNSLLSDNKDPIVSIAYKNIEHLGEINTMRSSYFDVFCQTESGADFIVEMQNGKQIYFKDRSLYYATIPIQEQGKKGKARDYHLEDVYLVAILDFVFPGDEYPRDEYFHEIKLMDVKDKHVFYDKLTLIYLEMPKIEDLEVRLDTMRDKWMYALYSLCYTDEQPPELGEEIFRKLFEEARLANFNEQQLFSYQMSLKDLWDSYSTWKCANQEGLEQGKELGMAEGKELGIAEGKTLGIAEGKRQIARKMLSMGMSKEAVLEATGLTEEELHG